MRAAPHTKFPKPATEEQQAIIGSPAACFPRLTLGLFIFYHDGGKKRGELRFPPRDPASIFLPFIYIPEILLKLNSGKR
ncbi:MAG: hypothetical protein DRP00_01295 [Candidatus Aenigmatarchaeota archaeon]|nr:MAG: hypothetical protein DRP00_01295 [Candidatus Aenigmarchaeota archaeon]